MAGKMPSGARRKARRKVGLEVLEGTAERPLALRPSRALPGSEEKIRELEERVARRERTDHPGDLWHDASRRLERERAANGALVTTGRVVPVEGKPDAGENLRASGWTTGHTPRFGANLRRLRLEAGVKQSALARRAGVTRRYVIRLEAGERCPSLSTLVALARALRLGSLDPLAGYAPPPAG